ncbi:DNA polymerase III subunit alpha [uncultured Mesonia sp.]|uniref:DNA polymerase III subunit alpha n=1 Tax=uncultured Mesonia sp. TaxID=399731 RepID=UPI00374E49D3
MYLNCHSWFSLRYGVIPEDELCDWVLAQGVQDFVLTDINSTSACLSFIKHAQKRGVCPRVGVDFRNEHQQLYVGIAQNNQGYYELNRFLSQYLEQQQDFPLQAPNLPNCYFIYPIHALKKLVSFSLLSQHYVGVSFTDLLSLKRNKLAYPKEKLVFLQSLSFRNKKDFNAHRLLRSIDLNCLLSKLPEAQQGQAKHTFYTPEVITQSCKGIDYLLKQTQELLANCRVDFKFGVQYNKNLQLLGKTQEEDTKRLKDLCYQKLPKRYPQASVEVMQRVKTELNAIIKLGFVSYFLINYDIICYAQKKNYAYIGRGSGANSVVAYILEITNVDPIELDLYFERFINAGRSSPPDFDLDFSWKDRDDITRYIFSKYTHTALMGTYVTFKRKAVIRELGKVFGLPKAQIDRLSKGRFNDNQLDHLERLVLRYSKYIAGFPNYISVHSGGILILNQPVFHYAATFMPPKGFATIQIDMHIAEEAGIHKFDILAQRGLSKITDALALIKANQPQAKLKDINKVDDFKQDTRINALLAQGDCMGVFYIESPGMRALLTKLKTDNYLNLVAASSIIRPGVSSAGMKEEFIKRHRQPEKRKEAHPVLNQIMPDAYGIMVYQEDVMKVAHHFAGLDLEDADILRRGMSGKKTSKNQMQRIEQKFISNCLQKGYSREIIHEIWGQIASFAGYAFPKGHSASYAVESYQSLYLKCYFPLEFMVAVINNGGGFYGMQTYLQELRNCGGRVHLPCVNQSHFALTIDKQDVYLGLGYLKELEQKNIQLLLEERNFGGAFRSLEDFLNRLNVSIEQVSILINAGAFRFTGQSKYELLWQAHFQLSTNPYQQQVNRWQQKLFVNPTKKYELPALEQNFLSDAYDQMHLLGFHVYHPFQLLQHKISSKLGVRHFSSWAGKSICIYGDLICLKTTKTSKGAYMAFGTFYDAWFEVFDTVHFPATYNQFPIYGMGIYKIVGKLTYAYEYPSIIVSSIEKQAVRKDPRFV